MRVWLPLPDRDFEPGEAAIPWRTITRAGHDVVFATERGEDGPYPEADPRLLSGVLFGRLGASPDAKDAYREMRESPAMAHRVAWGTIRPEDFDGLVLPGGHARGMRQYLGSEVLQEKVGEFFRLGRPVGAICHGVLVLARAKNPQTGKSVLFGRRTTSLLRYQELLAYYSTAWKLGSYYRTYPETVEHEVKAALASPRDYEHGPFVLGDPSKAQDDRKAFVVEDGNYVSARWPGDATLFARRFLVHLESRAPAPQPSPLRGEGASRPPAQP
jgi:putative intracellular protease/amidase